MNLFGFMQIELETRIKKHINFIKEEITEHKNNVDWRVKKIGIKEYEIERLNELNIMWNKEIELLHEEIKEQEFIFYTRTGRFPD